MFKKAKENKKGFTLAELLIVVAIIAVLVAISIPIFSSQLEKSREAVDLANIRAAYAECQTEVLTSNKPAYKSVALVQTDLTKWTINAKDVAGVDLSSVTLQKNMYVNCDANGKFTLVKDKPTTGTEIKDSTDSE